MKFRVKTFPILQITIFFMFFILVSCEEENRNIINNDQFIEIYARLLIIHEMEINTIVFNPCANQPLEGDFMSVMKQNMGNLKL